MIWGFFIFARNLSRSRLNPTVGTPHALTFLAEATLFR